MKSPPQTRKGSFLGRTQKHKKAVGVRAGRGKCGAIKSTSSIVTQGDMWWMRSQLWWLKGADQALLGFILRSVAVCKETFASCHKRLRPLFYGVQTRGGMSIHSSCLAAVATGPELISPPPRSFLAFLNSWAAWLERDRVFRDLISSLDSICKYLPVVFFLFFRRLFDLHAQLFFTAIRASLMSAPLQTLSCPNSDLCLLFDSTDIFPIVFLPLRCGLNLRLSPLAGSARGIQNEHQPGERLPEKELARQCKVASLRLPVLLLYSRMQSVARHLPQQEGT